MQRNRNTNGKAIIGGIFNIASHFGTQGRGFCRVGKVRVPTIPKMQFEDGGHADFAHPT